MWEVVSKFGIKDNLFFHCFMKSVLNYPHTLWERLPETRSMGDYGQDKERITSFGKRCLESIVSDHFKV